MTTFRGTHFIAREAADKFSLKNIDQQPLLNTLLWSLVRKYFGDAVLRPLVCCGSAQLPPSASPSLRHCSLVSYGFLDDVIFSHNGRSIVARRQWSSTNDPSCTPPSRLARSWQQMFCGARSALLRSRGKVCHLQCLVWRFRSSAETHLGVHNAPLNHLTRFRHQEHEMEDRRHERKNRVNGAAIVKGRRMEWL